MHCATRACLFFSLQHLVAAYTISSALHFISNTFVGAGIGKNLLIRTPSPQPEFLDSHSCKSLSGDIKEITKRPLRNESSEPCEDHQIALFVQHRRSIGEEPLIGSNVESLLELFTRITLLSEAFLYNWTEVSILPPFTTVHTSESKNLNILLPPVLFQFESHISWSRCLLLDPKDRSTLAHLFLEKFNETAPEWWWYLGPACTEEPRRATTEEEVRYKVAMKNIIIFSKKETPAQQQLRKVYGLHSSLHPHVSGVVFFENELTDEAYKRLTIHDDVFDGNKNGETASIAFGISDPRYQMPAPVIGHDFANANPYTDGAQARAQMKRKAQKKMFEAKQGFTDEAKKMFRQQMKQSIAQTQRIAIKLASACSGNNSISFFLCHTLLLSRLDMPFLLTSLIELNFYNSIHFFLKMHACLTTNSDHTAGLPMWIQDGIRNGSFANFVEIENAMLHLLA